MTPPPLGCVSLMNLLLSAAVPLPRLNAPSSSLSSLLSPLLPDKPAFLKRGAGAICAMISSLTRSLRAVHAGL